MQTPKITMRTVFVLLLAVLVLPLHAGTNYWTGAGDKTNWFNDANWSQTHVPLATEDVVISNAYAGVMVLLTNSTASLGAFIISNATLTFSNWNTALQALNVEIRSNGILTHAVCNTNPVVLNTNRVYIIASNVTIRAGGRINANSKGFVLDQGPGAATSGSQGGSHGGNAGGRTGFANGSLLYPAEPGSGGDSGPAGGCVVIEATNGTVRVDGLIDADAIFSQEGPGSGGGILIKCRVFDGSGELRANGGTAKTGGNGSGGGGGRIAIHYDPVAQAAEAPGATSIVIMASGGYAATYGEPGTVYLPDLALLCQPNFNLSGAPTFGVGSGWGPDSLSLVGRQVVLPNSFVLSVTQNLSISASGSAVGTAIGNMSFTGDNLLSVGGDIGINSGTLRYVFSSANLYSLSIGGNLTLTNGAVLRLYAGVTNPAIGLPYGGLVDLAGDLIVNSNCTIYPYSDSTNGGSVELRVRNAYIRSNGWIKANGTGYRNTKGPGYTNTASSAAGYGGKGGGINRGGNSYGSAICPVDPGSGGAAENGAGLIWIMAENGTVRVDGTLDASATGAQEGSGSGGGILVLCKYFEGAGALNAKGGTAILVGKADGGGGRIAVLQMDNNFYARVRRGVTNGVAYGVTPPATFVGSLSVTQGTANTNYPAMPGTIRFGIQMPVPGTILTIH